MLHYGIINWDCISHTFSATGHLPAGIFARPLRMMEEAWEGIEEGELLSKLSVNALIGLMAIDQSKMYRHSCSTTAEDMPEQASLQSVVCAGDKTLYDFVTVTNLMSSTICA